MFPIAKKSVKTQLISFLKLLEILKEKNNFYNFLILQETS